MHSDKIKQVLNLYVTEELSVNVIPNTEFEFLMTTKEVANGYGVTEYAIRKNKLSLGNELVEGKHFTNAVTIGNGKLRLPHNAILWTKRGVIRLGFAMRSERAKIFRDWAEELIITLDEQKDLFGAVATQKALPPKRKHNRLTPTRINDLMADVVQIENTELRLSITKKLGL